jgi:hypothetical protein
MVFYEFDSDKDLASEKVIVRVTSSPRDLAKYGRKTRVLTANLGSGKNRNIMSER